MKFLLKNKIRKSPAFQEVGSYTYNPYGREIEQNKKEKIVVFGLPKSGNVWLVSLLSEYLNLPVIDPYNDVDKYGIGMCHLPFSEKVSNREDFVHGIYLQRDLRDVIVSYFHHTMRADWRKNFPHYQCYSVDEFYWEWFLPRVCEYQKIHSHASGYLKRGLPIVKYENLCKDTFKYTSKIILQLGFDIKEKLLKEIIEKNEITELKKKGKKLNDYVPKEHFRKGGHGGYTKELSQSIISDIERRFDSILRDGGYIV